VYQLLAASSGTSVHLYTHPAENAGSTRKDRCLLPGWGRMRFKIYQILGLTSQLLKTIEKQDAYNKDIHNKELARLIQHGGGSVVPLSGRTCAVMKIDMHTRFDLPTALRIVEGARATTIDVDREPGSAENMEAMRKWMSSKARRSAPVKIYFSRIKFETLLAR